MYTSYPVVVWYRFFVVRCNTTRMPESRFRCYVTIFATCHATLNVRIKVSKKDNSLHKLGPPVINIELI